MKLELVKKRRGINQIIGSLFMLALVVPVGTVILTKGLGEAGEITGRLASGITYQNEGGREAIIFENVRFEPTGNQVTVSIRNVGSVESTIIKVVMVKRDTQDILINENNMVLGAQQRTGTDVVVPADLQFSQRWDDPNYVNSEYKISIMTAKGNFFETVARPFNT